MERRARERRREHMAAPDLSFSSKELFFCSHVLLIFFSQLCSWVTGGVGGDRRLDAAQL